MSYTQEQITIRAMHADIIELLMNELAGKGFPASSLYIIDHPERIVYDIGSPNSYILNGPIYRLEILLAKLGLLVPMAIKVEVQLDSLCVNCRIDGLYKHVLLADPLVFEKTCDIILDHIELRRIIEANY